jgi:uncharacterized cupin superfamily protein
MRHPNVRNIDEVDTREMGQGRHRLRLRRLGEASGSRKVGAMLTEVPPGAVSFPFHAHTAAEEGIYVLSGTGEARIGEARIAVRPGDWIAFPAGPAHAHQMINSSDAETLVYLCVSTQELPEVVLYPDSKKTGVMVPDETAPLGFRYVGAFREEQSLGYWDGEPEAG